MMPGRAVAAHARRPDRRRRAGWACGRSPERAPRACAPRRTGPPTARAPGRSRPCGPERHTHAPSPASTTSSSAASRRCLRRPWRVPGRRSGGSRTRSRCAAARRHPVPSMFSPQKMTTPASGVRMPAATFASVVLPALRSAHTPASTPGSSRSDTPRRTSIRRCPRRYETCTSSRRSSSVMASAGLGRTAPARGGSRAAAATAPRPGWSRSSRASCASRVARARRSATSGSRSGTPRSLEPVEALVLGPLDPPDQRGDVLPGARSRCAATAPPSTWARCPSTP